jgi:hypothetical protein
VISPSAYSDANDHADVETKQRLVTPGSAAGFCRLI